MQRIEVEAGGRSYPVLAGAGLLADAKLLSGLTGDASLLIVSDATVAPLWMPRLHEGLAGRKAAECILPAGEQHKTLHTISTVIDALVAARINRDGLVLALGGGVVGDTAGFAAACYQRGIGVLQLPTTLLAQVDASVGGKTGVNHPGGKNLIGAFHQPVAVVADTDTLSTLPDRELRAGLAEVIKTALVRDAGFFDWLEQNLDALLARDGGALAHAIGRCCGIKAAIVARDEREAGERAILNLGHTFGHAIETGLGHGKWLHGEAIAAGLVMAAGMSLELGWIDAPALERIRAIVRRAGLPESAPGLSPATMVSLMGLDKKVRAARIRLVLLRGIGAAECTADYPDAALEAALGATPR